MAFCISGQQPKNTLHGVSLRGWGLASCNVFLSAGQNKSSCIGVATCWAISHRTKSSESNCESNLWGTGRNTRFTVSFLERRLEDFLPRQTHRSQVVLNTSRQLEKLLMQRKRRSTTSSVSRYLTRSRWQVSQHFIRKLQNTSETGLMRTR